MDTSRRRNFIVRGLLALAGGLLGRKALAADTPPTEEGPLTTEGALAAVRGMNRNRAVHDKLAVLLESGQAEVIRGIVEVMYDHLVHPGSLDPPPSPFGPKTIPIQRRNQRP